MRPKDGKTKGRVIAIAAAGALAILLASTLARCAVSDTDGGADGSQSGPATEQQQQRPDASPEEPESAIARGSETTLEKASSVSWVADDGSGATLQITDASLIEKGADGAIHAVAYSSADESATDGQALVTLTLEDGTPATLIVALDGGEPAAIASDALESAERYVAKPNGSAGEPFTVTGLDEQYLAMIGGDEEGLTRAIAEYASRKAPQAGSASFDGEVYLDLDEGMVSATFHLDDSASTVATVLFEDGAFEIL